MTTPRMTNRAVALGAILLSPVLLHAQAAAPAANPPASNPPVPSDAEVVTLTPFEVSGNRDTGYQATETLAGTRIRTDLRDVGAAVTVVTKEFLKDIGATDNSTLLQYTTNTEVGGTRGTYTGLGNGTSVDESANLRAPAGAQRVRGLASADNARDFFVTDIPWDSYIVDRVDIQRGPNSILFGLGSPAGIVNATTRSAEFRNTGAVDVRIGSYGTTRSSLDINQQIIPKTLAVRIDGLWKRELFRQDPAFENDKRLFGALRYDPQLFKSQDFHTSIKAKYEHGDIKANRPRTVTPNDNISAWFRPSAITADNPFGGMNRVVANNGYDAWRSDAANITAGDGRGLVISGTVNYNPYFSALVNQQQPFWLIDGATNQLYRVEGGWINVGARNSDGTVRGASQGLIGKRTNDQFYQIAGLPQAAVGLNLPNSQFGQYRQQSLLDSSIFDFYNNLIDGPNKREWEKWDTYNINLSQTFWRDRLGLEFAYDRQKYNRGGENFFGGAPGITMDIMRNFADYYTTGASGLTTTNPNFGRPYVSGGGGNGGSSYTSDRKYLRGSLFAELRAQDLTKNEFMIKLLGKHRFNGVYANEKYGTETLGWQMFANSREWAAYWNGTDGLGSPLNDRPPVAVVYLGPSIANRTAAAGAGIPGVTTNITFASAPVRVFDSTWNSTVPFGQNWNVPASMFRVFGGVPDPTNTTQLTQASNPDNYRGWTTFQDNLLAYNNGADKTLLTRAQKSMRETDSLAGSWQGFFWKDAFVLTYGWRFDEVKSGAVNALNNGANRNILNLSDTGTGSYTLPSGANIDRTIHPNQGYQVFKDHSTSGGVVAHLNRIFPRDFLPLNVSLSYNESRNFQVTDARRDLYGNVIANPTGRTIDYGVVLSTKDNKYSLRAIKYTTSVQNASSGLSDPGGIGRVIQQGLRFRNVFLYRLGAYDWATREQPQSRNTWGGSTAQGDAVNGAVPTITFAQGRALEDSAIRTWNEIQSWLTDRGFFNAWGFQPQPVSVLTDRTTYEANPSRYTPPNTASVFAYVANPPPGFTVTADTESKGYEFELTANPTRNWRLAFNASETEAVRRNVGGRLLDEYISYLDSKLVAADGSLTPAGSMPQFGNTSLNVYANVFGPWRANYVQMKLQEGAAAPEIRKWRYNFVSNYSFREGKLKGLGVGGSYRWQDKVIIGYPTTSTGRFDLSKPYYGPSEHAIDLWTSYERKLTEKINWRIQLNVRNAFASDGLIPISVEPDGKTWASVRVKPNQEWFLTNTFSF